MSKGKSIVKGLDKLGELLGGTYAERMARAAEQGYDISRPVYHGTATDFPAFDPERAIGTNFWSTTDKAAIEAGDVGAQGKGVIKEMYHRIQNPAGWAEYDKYTTDELIARGYDGLALPDADGHITYSAFSPNQYRDVNADFNPANADSSNLLASVSGAAPYLAGAAALTGLAPEDAAAMETRSAASDFINRRQSKRGFWQARRQDLLDMVDSIGGFVEGTAFPALDKPLQGYMGLAGVAGTLASGGSFEDAIRAGAQNAQRPTEQTAYQYGGTVTDAVSPYLPAPVAAGAGTAVQTGLQLFSPI